MGDVWFTASDVGWVVGHSYIVYAPLLTGATTVLYEGKPVGTPDASAFWRVISDHGVKAMFTAPTAYRAIKREDPDGTLMAGHDLSTLKCVFLAGERLDPDTYEWTSALLGVPVVDNWWQTETGWPIAANLRGLEPMPIKPGSPTVPVPGFDVRILGEGGRELGAQLLLRDLDAGLEHHEPARDLALHRVRHADHGALGDRRVRGQHLLHAAGGQPVPGHVDHVVGAAHHVQVAVVVDQPSVAGQVVPRER